jgi:hypothetical protein
MISNCVTARRLRAGTNMASAIPKARERLRDSIAYTLLKIRAANYWPEYL